MNNVISEISNSFIKEALASPKMLEDLAAMEKYMSESYDGRTFVELLQNADDADSTKVKVLTIDDTLIVANDGRAFDKDDIMAISRSGASSKQRGDSIGYRGVGFKSATTISTEIVIHSSSAYFTFSKSICAKKLKKHDSQVPTVRIPFLYEMQNLDYRVNDAIDNCKAEGFSTFFVFNKANVGKFLKEIEGFDFSWLIFLRNITNVEIVIGSFVKKCVLHRKIITNEEILLSVNGSNNQWYIVSSGNVALAFKFDPVDGIIPCEDNEAVFHCFLPTLDKTGFPFKINADFSTDPSRKHIIQDESTNKALSLVQALYVHIVNKILYSEKEKYYPILALLNTHTTLNQLVRHLENGLLDKLQDDNWVPTYCGEFRRPGNVKTFPKWINTEDRSVLVEKVPEFHKSSPASKLYESVKKIDVLLNKLGAEEYSIIDFWKILANKKLISQLRPEIIGMLFVHCYRTMFLDTVKMNEVYIPSLENYILLKEVSMETKLNEIFLSCVKEHLNVKELESLSTKYPVFSSLQRKKSVAIKPLTKEIAKNSGKSPKSSQLAINKWKTPVQNCMTIESLAGNIVKNVEKKNQGYSVISTDSNGNEFYITAKTVGDLEEPFNLSESEYKSAQIHADNYKVYLFTTNTSNIKYDVISNPIKKLCVEKHVKEWEWICTENNVDRNNEENEPAFDLLPIDIDSENEFDKMTGEQFEQFCAQLLIKNGYEDVTVTKVSGDQGIDIIAYKDCIKYGIQCKCYSSDIGNSAVQEVFAGKTYYKCNVGIVLTNRYFTSSAVQLADNNGVVLWPRDMLIKLIKNARI